MAQCRDAHAHVLSWATRLRTLPPQAAGYRLETWSALGQASQREPLDRATAPSPGAASPQTLSETAWRFPIALAVSHGARRSVYALVHQLLGRGNRDAGRGRPGRAALWPPLIRRRARSSGAPTRFRLPASRALNPGPAR